MISRNGVELKLLGPLFLIKPLQNLGVPDGVRLQTDFDLHPPPKLRRSRASVSALAKAKIH